MFSSLVQTFGGWPSFLLILATVICFVFFFCRELALTSKTKKQLLKLSEIKNDRNEIEIQSISSSQLTWITDHLLYTKTENHLQIEEKNGLWLSKTPVSQMLPNHDSSRYKLVPALLTSIGITGTFLGITLGLNDFNISGDSSSLLASAGHLLEGMKTAFYTSLAGLSLSAFFMSLMKWSSSAISKAQNAFITSISMQYFEASPVMYLKNMSNEAQDQVIAAQMRSATAIERLGDKMESTMQGFGKIGDTFNGDAISESVSKAVSHSIEHSLAPTMEAIKTELAALKEIKQENQKELIDLVIGEMKSQLIEPVTNELSKTSEAIDKSNKVSEQLNSNVERVITSTSATVETINEFQKETMAKLQSFAESLKEILSSFKDDTQGAMQEIATEVNSMLTSANDGMSKQRQAFESSTIKASEAFDGIKNSMNAALSERQSAEKELFENVTNKIGSLLDQISSSFDAQSQVISDTGNTAAGVMKQAQASFETSIEERRKGESKLFDEMENRIGNLLENSQCIFKQQADAITQIGEDASSLMASAKDELQNGLGDIDTKVKSMSDTVQKELESFRAQYQENLTNYFESQNNLLEQSLGKQRDGLNGVVENFRKVFESEYQTRHNLLQELTAQHEKLQQSAKVIEEVAKAIGLSEASKMAELQDAAQTMGREIGQLKKEYSKAAATFTDITENLPKAMDEYFSRANQSFETFFKDFDQSASTIHNKLSQAAGYLINSQVQRREFEADKETA